MRFDRLVATNGTDQSIRPPGRNTRPHSRNALAKSGMCSNTSSETTASKQFDAKDNRVRSSFLVPSAPISPNGTESPRYSLPNILGKRDFRYRYIGDTC